MNGRRASPRVLAFKSAMRALLIRARRRPPVYFMLRRDFPAQAFMTSARDDDFSQLTISHYA